MTFDLYFKVKLRPKPRKKPIFIKIFFSRTISPRVFESIEVLSQVCLRQLPVTEYFYFSEIMKVKKITISMLKTFLLLVLEQRIVSKGFRKSYPRDLKMCSYLTFELNFKVKPKS
jgi:hypothetical protein